MGWSLHVTLGMRLGPISFHIHSHLRFSWRCFTGLHQTQERWEFLLPGYSVLVLMVICLFIVCLFVYCLLFVVCTGCGSNKHCWNLGHHQWNCVWCVHFSSYEPTSSLLFLLLFVLFPPFLSLSPPFFPPPPIHFTFSHSSSSYLFSFLSCLCCVVIDCGFVKLKAFSPKTSLGKSILSIVASVIFSDLFDRPVNETIYDLWALNFDL